MTDFNVGRRIVEHVLDSQLEPFLEEGLNRDWIKGKDSFTYTAVFAEDIDVQAYLFLLDYYNDHGVIPTKELFGRNFPSYRPEPTEYNADELIDAALDAIRSAIVAEDLAMMTELEREGNYEAAFERMMARGERFGFKLAEYELETAIQNEMRRQKIVRTAQIRLNSEAQGNKPLKLLSGPEIEDLDITQEWRIEGLIAQGGNVMINAQAKAGKSTLVINLIRCLMTGENFLGEFPVEKVSTVRVIDLEMPIASSRRWLREAGLTKFPGVEYAFLVGQASDFMVTNELVRRKLADSLKGADVLVIDPVGPLLAAMGLDENSPTDIRLLLNSLTELKEMSGSSEMIVIHHAGHGMARARGASTFNDWPDCFMVLTNTDPGNQSGVRKLTARGRDVDFSRELKYHAPTRSLATMDAHFSAREEGLHDKIIKTLLHGRLSTRTLYSKVGGDRTALVRAVKTLVDQGKLRVIPVGNARYYELVG